MPFIKITDHLESLLPPAENHSSVEVEADSGLQPPACQSTFDTEKLVSGPLIHLSDNNLCAEF